MKRALILHPDNPLWMLVPLGGKLGVGRFSVIEAQDAHEVAKHDWYGFRSTRGRCLYAATNVKRQDGTRTTLLLHRLIAGRHGFGDAETIDHVNGDGLRNVGANLRPASNAENNRNKKPHADNTSGYKGVYWDAARQKWLASIGMDGQSLFLGRYTDQADAVAAYDRAALKYHGNFALTNVPSNDNAVRGAA